ncbi:hypothetical protein DICVIV_05339 [Dictyocaulus viviparus]|uniref:Uncharacterized protein n=1 Tax=Dictyocaulus viviparus TaxID=29172 RepID=A0A0D8XV78_DICVI|nr:hypothetical protein DICVIV_05339 [Dictyocaulus viviparus]
MSVTELISRKQNNKQGLGITSVLSNPSEVKCSSPRNMTTIRRGTINDRQPLKPDKSEAKDKGAKF